MHPLLFQFGHLAIPTYGAFTAIALVAALALLIYFAKRLALNANKLWNLGLIGILTALVAARVLVVAEYFGAFRQHPFWVLGLTSIRAAWVGPAALLIGLFAAMLYALAEGLPLLRVLDCIAPAATLGIAIHRVGALFAGSGFGLPTEQAWGVTYTSGLSALWYHAPLGVRLVPVQLYEAAALLLILAALFFWLPRRTRDGELWGGWLFLAGIAGFFLGFYRAASLGAFWVHEVVFVVMVMASGAFLTGRKAKTGSYNGVNDPQHI